LTTYPQHIPELREEIDALVAENGWQKSTLMKMKKLDSFVKESLRMNMVSGGISSLHSTQRTNYML